MTDLPFLTKLREFLILENVDIKLYTRKGKTCNYYLLQTTSIGSCLRFCEKMYENSEFFLYRKFKKYQEFRKLKNMDNTELSSTITKGVETV